jgi:hypothetical protein
MENCTRDDSSSDDDDGDDDERTTRGFENTPRRRASSAYVNSRQKSASRANSSRPAPAASLRQARTGERREREKKGERQTGGQSGRRAVVSQNLKLLEAIPLAGCVGELAGGKFEFAPLNLHGARASRTKSRTTS